MSTKETILNVSLKLFAKKGYEGVSVREIAHEVGVRESALYKHYKNKEDILAKIMERMEIVIHEAYISYEVPEVVTSDVSGGYKRLTNQQLCELSWKLFSLFTQNPMISDFRKLLMREQFNNFSFAKIYNEFFLKGVVEKQAQTFKTLVQGNMFREEDPEIIALQFYGPILLLFQRFDCEPDNIEQIKEMLYKHVTVFGKNYVKEA